MSAWHKFHFKKDQDFLWISSSRLDKNQPYFVSPRLKLHNQYCHTPKPSKYVKRVLCLLSNDNGRYLPHAGKRSYKKVGIWIGTYWHAFIFYAHESDVNYLCHDVQSCEWYSYKKTKPRTSPYFLLHCRTTVWRNKQNNQKS